MRSFIVTGASATGKSTLIRAAIKSGYLNIPTQTTRRPWWGEENGVDALFLTEEEFGAHVKEGMFLEDFDPALLEKHGIYYGTIKKALTLLTRSSYCCSPGSIQIAEQISRITKVYWVHLICTNEDRYNRLRERGLSDEEVRERMNSEDSAIIPQFASVINTSFTKPQDILQFVMG